MLSKLLQRAPFTAGGLVVLVVFGGLFGTFATQVARPAVG